MKNILKPNKKTFKEAAKIIKEGNLVAFPTETVYGLGADALNPKAVAKIFSVKNRPYFNPLIVHIANFKDLEYLSNKINQKTKLLIEKFWPGPLTLILPKSNIVPDIVTAGIQSVAIRMPSHPVALEFIKTTGTVIAAPSANPFGYISPTEPIHVINQIGDKIDLIIDGGKCPIGIESTVIELVNEPTILRFGAVPIEEIEEAIGKVKISTLSKTPRSPGQLSSHYSPQTKLKIIKKKIESSKELKIGLLAFKKPKNNIGFEKIEVLSDEGDLIEATSNLFSCLHKLDSANLDIIYVEPVPEIGLGRAIMDRLRKAEHKK